MGVVGKVQAKHTKHLLLKASKVVFRRVSPTEYFITFSAWIDF